jgi:hypothetical protein
LENPITAEEIYAALKSGGPNKAPGSDGLSREFYVRMWNIIREDMFSVMNQMYIHKDITRRQQHGRIVNIPKDTGDITPNGYRPITLMNSDYKLLARIMARRLTPVLEEQISSSQYCSVPGKSILEAVSELRDVTAHTELTRTPLCILSLDFRSAFDCISHQYVFKILTGYGISEWFIDRVRSMYKNVTASLQIKGALVGQIPFQSAIRQGCQLSMALYALCVHPLLRTLENRLMGVSIGEQGQRISVLAYADDITVLISNREDIDKVHQAIRIYEQTTGAKLNPNKSRAIAVGSWTEPITHLGNELCQHVTILEATCGPTMEDTIRESCTKVTNAVRAQARTAYARNLCLAHRVQYAKTYLLAKIWYLAQVLPTPTRDTQQLKSTCTWFIWKGAIFLVPITILQQHEELGGWSLLDIALKFGHSFSGE